MDYSEIKTKDLERFIQSAWFKNSPDLPVTTHRAISQVHNPRANPNDVCLILALNEQNKLLGYIGILPDNFADNSTHFGWLSCWWVHPEKGSKVGFSLFLQALIVWEHRFVITDFTPQIKDIIEKTAMFNFAPAQFGIRGFMGFDLSTILPRKHKFFKKIKAVLKFADYALNNLNIFRTLLLKRKFSLHQLDIEYEEHISDEIARFISTHQDK
ncbi:MAG: hypothetical protein U9R19_12710, partial [Bacteroidota bacterium]|nr:hypothetical protein [Bacteroidota bacterium]